MTGADTRRVVSYIRIRDVSTAIGGYSLLEVRAQYTTGWDVLVRGARDRCELVAARIHLGVDDNYIYKRRK